MLLSLQLLHSLYDSFPVLNFTGRTLSIIASDCYYVYRALFVLCNESHGMRAAVLVAFNLGKSDYGNVGWISFSEEEYFRIICIKS